MNSITSTPLWKQQLPIGIEKYACGLFLNELEQLCYPTLIILPLTVEGELQREWLMNDHHDSNGNLIHQSIFRYGAYEHNFKYKDETFLAILVNNN